MNHSFDVDLAVQFGIEEAIIIENLAFWIKKNVANNKNFIDGDYWTYNSASAFQELFPYMSLKKIQRTLTRLEEQKILKSGSYNKLKMDRTKWYCITDSEIKKLYKIPETPINTPLDILSNGKDKMTNGFTQNVQPIPDINTDINTDKKTTTKDTINYKEPEVEIETKDSSSSFLSENLKELKKYLMEHIQDIPTCKNIMFLVENRGLTLERIQTVVEYSKKNNKGNGYIYSALENNWDIPEKKVVVPSSVPTKKKQTLGEEELKDSLPPEEKEYKELEFKTHNIIKKQPDLVKEFYKIRNLEQLKQFIDKNNIKVS